MNLLASAKRRLLVVALLHSIPSTFFLYGEPFYAQKRFGWGPGTIGLSQAMSGLCIAFGAFTGGRIAHRLSPGVSVRLGMAGSLLGVAAGMLLAGPGGETALGAALAIVSFAQALAWPGIEAALMEGEPPLEVQRLTGRFNLTWSLGTATAFLVVTPTMHSFGLSALFSAPALWYAVTVPIAAALLRPGGQGHTESTAPVCEPLAPSPGSSNAARYRAGYRWIGWLANPFSYLAIMAIVTYSPSVRTHLHLSFAGASVWCGLYFYVRALAFELLRWWPGWHYRWGMLACVYLLTMVTFVVIILAPGLPVLVLGQVVFGLCVGLLYQSSLFYSMAGSEAAGEHGGAHETFIGLGIMAGPLLTFLGTTLAPGNRFVPIYLILTVMSVGLAGIVTVGLRVIRPLQRPAAV